MKFCFAALAVLVVLVGCDVRTGKDSNLPDVPMYPGAKIVLNGENQGVVSCVLETPDPRAKVVDFYMKALNGKNEAGAITGERNGHAIRVIVTDPPGTKTHMAITQPKSGHF